MSSTQVAKECRLQDGVKCEFIEILFQPVPWSPSTTRGMPQVKSPNTPTCRTPTLRARVRSSSAARTTRTTRSSTSRQLSRLMPRYPRSSHMACHVVFSDIQSVASLRHLQEDDGPIGRRDVRLWHFVQWRRWTRTILLRWSICCVLPVLQASHRSDSNV